MSNIQGKVVLITGASSGIGEAAARLIAAKGAHVVLGARRVERLQTLAADIEAQGGSARFRALDVTDALDMQAFADFAKHAFGKIDVIINNAGVMPLSPLAALNIAEWNLMLDVNVRGVLHGIAAVLPSMQAQGHGQIINISSIGGLAVSPTAAVYCATKFAVRAISDGLRQETDKIRVTVVCPGVVESELADSISDETARNAMKAFRKVALEPDAIARALVYAIEQPDGVDVSEIVVRPTGSAY
ncbi:SDR family oxidoreductase [Pseudomonas syringae]|uniref:SDR family oxidoreductase n=1 Tax=Pseudomonas syringae TaxID=317 RepID=UPI000C08006E|nr:SDR family oxidoreductase [Pseudomonas syringae]PHN78988.1 oxidoreductase [Pseudomonas syringae]